MNLMKEIVIHQGDVILILLVQLMVNILCFGWGKRAGLVQSLRIFEEKKMEIEEEQE